MVFFNPLIKRFQKLKEYSAKELVIDLLQMIDDLNALLQAADTSLSTYLAAVYVYINTNVANLQTQITTITGQITAILAILNPLDPWLFQPIGVPIPIWTHIGAPAPSVADLRYRYIKLTAADAYNTGVVGSESVTGIDPLVLATGVITDAGSILNGQTVSLINTERSSLRAGLSGTKQMDQMQQITGSVTARAGTTTSDVFIGVTGAFNLNAGANSASISGAAGASVARMAAQFDSANSPNARTGTETHSKNEGADYYMRIR